MTLQEFKAWFEGYTENITKQPTQKQWARIQERVDEIDGTTITYPVYVEKYWEPFRYPYFGSPTWAGTASGGTFTYTGGETAYNSTVAMKSLGRMEALPNNDGKSI